MMPMQQAGLRPGDLRRRRMLEDYDIAAGPEYDPEGGMPGDYAAPLPEAPPLDFANAMASEGRFGDTMMAHVTPGEVMIPPTRMTPKLMAAWLEAMAGQDPSRYVAGGANSQNPMTGAPEFYDVGSEAGPSGASNNEAASNGGYGEGDGGTQGALSQSFMGDPIGYGKAAIEGNLTGTQAMSGIAGLLGGFAPGIGLAPAAVAAMQDAFGISPDPDSFGKEGYNEGGQGGAGNETRAFAAPPTAAGSATITPPASFAPPGGLGLENLSDIQRRSMIASYGTQGNDGRYRDKSVQNYYRNLVSRGLNQNGTLAPLTDLLPVERSYLSGVMGLNNYSSTPQLLALLSQPS